MKTIKQSILFLLILFFTFGPLSAKKTPVEIKYSVMDLNGLRYYPFNTPADSLVSELIRHTKTNSSGERFYKKTAIDLIGNRELIEGQIQHSTQTNDFLYKYFLKSYLPWLRYAAPLKNDNRELALTLGLHEETQDKEGKIAFQDQGIYGFAGKRNVAHLLDDLFGDIDLFRKTNEVMFLSVKSPLSEEGFKFYRYFLSSRRTEEGEKVQEIVFFPKNIHTQAFTGYLYISEKRPYRLIKAVFTVSSSHNMNFIQNILFTQYFTEQKEYLLPVQKDYVLSIGDEVAGSLVVNRTVNYTDRRDPLTESERQVGNLEELSKNTRAYNNVKMITRLLLTDHLSVAGEKGIFEVGPVTRMLSYNDMEGVRLRLGVNTTTNLHKQWLFGGYAAYGTKDEKWKYRGDILYSFIPKDRDIWEFPERLLRVTYIDDLNIPGEDLFVTKRDYLPYSFSQVATGQMTRQKLAAIIYEHELENDLSFEIGGKYLKDRPLKGHEYIIRENGVEHKVNGFTTTEASFSMSYAPKSVFFQTRDRRRYLRRGEIEVNLKHTVGIKGMFGSDYSYHITDADVYKTFRLPDNIGKLSLEVAARKVWNRLPFPFLFVAGGNQSYIFKENDYNLMNYSEFVTDRFIAGHMNLQFNWSPFQLFFKNHMKTNFGIKAIYGPLSDKNNPDLHPGLFVLHEKIKPLGETPYLEINAGFSNILKFFRLEWVQRLTYLETNEDGNKKHRGVFIR
ncbi:MAG: DUF5686 family protein [Bacteroidales bacterium]|nr:DUF5686 family protein [Bacteroidales bacterium]